MNNRVVKNATWIIVCKIIEAVLHLVITMMTSRYLGPARYGIINYAASLMAFSVPFMHMGVRSILINEFVNMPNRKGETLGTALFLNLMSSFLCIIGISLYSYITNFNQIETFVVCVLYSVSLIFQAVEILQYWFQEKLISKYVSVSMLIAYAFMSIYQTVILFFNKGIYWFVFSEILKHLLIAVLLIYQYYKHKGDRLCISVNRAKQLFSRGKYYIVSNLMLTVFQQTDKIMLKQLVDESETGYYASAAVCASVANFVYLAISDSVRPVIFQSQLRSKTEFENNIKTSFSVIGWMSFFQCIIFTLFAPIAINILYGSDYLPAIKILRIITWVTAVSHLGLIRDIWILSQEKQAFMVKLNVVGAIVNVILNYLLIPICGGVGAAIASLISQSVATIFMCFIFKELRHVCILMLNGINPIFLFKFVSRRIKYDK